MRAPCIHIAILTAFLANTFGPVPVARAQDFRLPAPGIMVSLSPAFDPPILKGIKVHPDNPFRFDFILDKGDSVIPAKAGIQNQEQLKLESTKLIKYFLASLTIPEKDLWVNLSPYEKDRIIPNSFGLTEMGRDLLAEDYMLKQITASLIYPEGETGKRFWKRIYEKAAEKFGTTNIPVNTFNKVWIVPEKAVVYENAKAGTAYVVESKLKVMLEQDYLSLSKHTVILSAAKDLKNDVNALGSQIIREIVIPELTKEVNEDKNFSQLRQVYNSLILATWYKKKIKDSILEQVYGDKNKVAGVNIDDPKEKERIYQRYLQAFKKGVYNYIKEDFDPATQETMPRKYFSGGVVLDITNFRRNVLEYVSSIPQPDMVDNDRAMIVTTNMTGASAVLNRGIKPVFIYSNSPYLAGDWGDYKAAIIAELNDRFSEENLEATEKQYMYSTYTGIYRFNIDVGNNAQYTVYVKYFKDSGIPLVIGFNPQGALPAKGIHLRSGFLAYLDEIDQYSTYDSFTKKINGKKLEQLQAAAQGDQAMSSEEEIERVSVAVRSMDHSASSVVDYVVTLGPTFSKFYMIMDYLEKMNSSIKKEYDLIRADEFRVTGLLREFEKFGRAPQTGVLSIDAARKAREELEQSLELLKYRNLRIEEIGEKYKDLIKGKSKNDYDLTLEWANEAMEKLESRIEIAAGTKPEKALAMEDIISTVQTVSGKMLPNITVDDQLQPGTLIIGNKLSFASALLNIISNAQHFAWKNKGEEARVVMKLTQENDQIRIDISDNGAGIKPEFLEIVDAATGKQRLFNLNESEREGGTGLGTTEAWYAVQDMGGTIGVKSDAGKGATFTIDLPVANKVSSGNEIDMAMNSDNSYGEAWQDAGRGMLKNFIDDMIKENGPGMMDALEKRIASYEPGDAAYVIAYLSERPDRLRFLKIFLKFVKSEHRFVRLASVQAAEKINDGRVNEVLMTAVKDSDTRIATRALEILEKIGREEDIPELFRIAKELPEEEVFYIYDDHSSTVAYTRLSDENNMTTQHFTFKKTETIPNFVKKRIFKAISSIKNRTTEIRRSKKIEISDLEDQSFRDFMKWLKDNHFEDVVVFGGGVRDALIGRRSADFDITVAVPLTDQEYFQFISTRSQVNKKIILEIHKRLEALAKALNVPVEDFFDPNKHALWHGREVQYSGPYEKTDAEGRPVYMKRALVDSNSLSFFSSTPGPSILRMAIDVNGQLYGHVEGIDDLRQGMIRFIGNVNDVSIGAVMRVIRLQCELGLSLTLNDEEAIRRVVKDYIDQRLYERDSFLKDVVIIKQLNSIKKIVDEKRSRIDPMILLQALGMTELIQDHLNIDLKQFFNKDQAMTTQEDEDNLMWKRFVKSMGPKPIDQKLYDSVLSSVLGEVNSDRSHLAQYNFRQEQINRPIVQMIMGRHEEQALKWIKEFEKVPSHALNSGRLELQFLRVLALAHQGDQIKALNELSDWRRRIVKLPSAQGIEQTCLSFYIFVIHWMHAIKNVQSYRETREFGEPIIGYKPLSYTGHYFMARIYHDLGLYEKAKEQLDEYYADPKANKEDLRIRGLYDEIIHDLAAKGPDVRAVDRAQTAFAKGGIDLTPAKMNLQVQNQGDEIRFHLNPAMLAQLQNAPGFVPVIINIRPMTDLGQFLGLAENH
jgi:signal transduction histidine kinase/ribosomal protein L21E